MPPIGEAQVLIMATNRFEESELFGPREILLGKGAKVTLASLDLEPDHGHGARRAGQDDHAGFARSRDANAGDYDALLLPGGVGNPDRLADGRGCDRADPRIRRCGQAGRRRSAMGRGCWSRPTCCAARRATSWPSIRTDLRNAGAKVVDEEAVTDGNIITSRKPDDVPAFTEALIAAIEAQGLNGLSPLVKQCTCAA